MMNVKRTPECVSLIAAAVNKEREIYEKSNTRGVYSNLCVQALSHSDSGIKELRAQQPPKLEPYDSLSLDLQVNDAVVEALKATGLISDSPPGSPLSKEENKGCLHANTSSVPDLEDDPTLKKCSEYEVEFHDNFSERLVTSASQNISAAVDVNVKPIQLPLLVEQAVFNSGLQGAEKGGGNLQHEFAMFGNRERIDAAGELNAQVTLAFTDHERAVWPVKWPADKETMGDQGFAVRMDTTDNERGGGEARDILKNSIDQSAVEDTTTRDSSVCSTVDVKPPMVERETEKMNNSAMPQLQPNSACGDAGSDIDVYKSLPAVAGNCEKTTHTHKTLSHKEALQPAGATQVVWKQLEKYIKEHIRPLHKSGVITTEQYQWAVAKTTSKVMQYHADAKSAEFIITEGDKVKKLAEQYLKLFKKQKCV